MLALVNTPLLVDMLEGLGVELPRTLPGARALGELEVAYHAADTLPDRMVAMLGLSGPVFAGWLVPCVPFVVELRPRHLQRVVHMLALVDTPSIVDMLEVGGTTQNM